MRSLFSLILATIAATAFLPAAHAQSFDWVSEDIDVYDMTVLRVGVGRMTVNIDGVGRRSFRVPPEFQFYIDGKPTRLRELQERQELTAYVKRSSSGTLELVDAGPVQRTPPTRPASKPIVATTAPLPQDMAALPKTGSVLPLPLAIALGAGTLAVALRRRRAAVRRSTS